MATIEDDSTISDDELNNKLDKIDDYIEKLYCEIVERLTKICAITEGDDYSNHDSVKTLAKYMYKFEVALEKLMKIIKSGKSKSFSDGTLPLGIVQWVNESKHPVHWILSNAYNRRSTECNKLMAASQSLNLFKSTLLNSLQQENLRNKL